MQRVGTVLLAVLAAVVLAGAVYVVSDNGSHGGSDAVASFPPTPDPSPTTSSSEPTAATSTPSAHRPVIAFLGDDWTSGRRASTAAKRFSSLVCAALDAREKNFGADGTGYAQTTASDGDYDSRAPAVIAAAPDVVVVSGGRNDVDLDHDTVAADATKLLTRLVTGLPSAKVLVVAPFWGDSDAPSTLDDVADRLRTAADKAGATYLDLPDPVHGHSDFMADDADPDDDGYAAVAAALEPKIKAALGD